MLTSDGRTPAARPAAAATASRPAPPAVSGSPDSVVLSRRDVDDALGDFARLTSAIRGSFSASGVTVDAVGEGTIFQRAGLRGGDVITAVDGVRLRSLDDAANVYARASTAQAITAQIVRAGKPMTLHVTIQ
jgi:S1-C subfamily serine protease